VPQADSHRTGPPNLRRPGVQWRDLTALSAQDVATELLISLPWLVVSLLLANAGRILIALPCSFMFFLTGLRQVHGAFHYSLGLRRKPTELVMLGLSGLMLGSMHAVQFNHLRHHTHCMEEDDVETMSAKMRWWRAETVPARTIRGRLKPFVTYEMFYHLEHHLFPAVPTRRLPELARRLDAVAPELSERRVF
jgi:fatty acid desaturase